MLSAFAALNRCGTLTVVIGGDMMRVTDAVAVTRWIGAKVTVADAVVVLQ